MSINCDTSVRTETDSRRKVMLYLGAQSELTMTRLSKPVHACMGKGEGEGEGGGGVVKTNRKHCLPHEVVLSVGHRIEPYR